MCSALPKACRACIRYLNNFYIRLFITNMEDESKNAAIAFLREDDSAESATWIHHWFRDNHGVLYRSCGKPRIVTDDIGSNWHNYSTEKERNQPAGAVPFPNRRPSTSPHDERILCVNRNMDACAFGQADPFRLMPVVESVLPVRHSS